MAIAFDAKATATGAGTSLTFAQTCTGMNRCLIVGVIALTAGDAITGVTYGGVSMTQINKQVNSAGQFVYLFSLLRPATGANNVVISASGAITIEGHSASYTGVRQAGQPDSSAVGTQLATATYSPSTTSVVDQCWIVGVGKNQSGANTAGANTVVRQDGGAPTGTFLADSGAARSIGANVLNLVTGVATDWASVIASLAPGSGGGMLAVF